VRTLDDASTIEVTAIQTHKDTYATHPITGEAVRVGGVERPLVTRPLRVTGFALEAGIISRHVRAVPEWSSDGGVRVTALALWAAAADQGPIELKLVGMSRGFCRSFRDLVFCGVGGVSGRVGVVVAGVVDAMILGTTGMRHSPGSAGSRS
jgi:hypothetical protein